MALKLYNTLTRQKEEFKPLSPPEVKIYVCGPTVYNFLHVGNFRGPVVFNLLRNWLAQKGFKVICAMNFTDVDDKIIEAAKTSGTSPKELTEKYIAEYQTDFRKLGLEPHEFNPKVTETMDQIRTFIQTLETEGKAYVTGNDVYYSVRSFPEYGKLSGRKIDELRSGARVEVDERKRDPLDFALWKGAKPGEISWESAWGAGRPGWAIECSAMACHYLGEQIDIHGGGTDLMFPHHENEIAQSEGATHKRFVGTWMHWNMLNFSGQKMSKSLGNFTTMREFLEHHHPEIYKWMILSVHYRHTAEFGPDAVERAVSGLGRIYSALANAEVVLGAKHEEILADAPFQKIADATWVRIADALDDDLNTAEALGALFEFVRQFNTQVKWGAKPTSAIQGKALVFRELVRKFGQLLSLFQEAPSAFLHDLDDLLLKAKQLARADVQAVVDQRSAARAAKDFKTSDELRAKLSGMGIAVSDTPDGTHWEVAK